MHTWSAFLGPLRGPLRLSPTGTDRSRVRVRVSLVRFGLALVVLGCVPRPGASPTATGPDDRSSRAGVEGEPADSEQGEGAEEADHDLTADGEEEGDDADDGIPHDEVEDEGPGAPALAEAERPPHPLDGIATAELERWLQTDRRKLGSMSIGLPNSGRLINAVQLPESPYWERVVPYTAWGTQETVDYLTQALAKVHAQFPGSDKLFVGDISAERGGYLSPHLSHQSGRDVDISFFYRKDAVWYRRANANNLDLERTWAFIRALITETDVRFILIDHSLQPLLRKHAERIGENAEWLDAVFRGTGTARGAILRHAPGHATHLHIRFDAPIAQETARRCYSLLLKHKLVEPPTYTLAHKVKKGETLGKLAKRYGTSIPELKRINGLKSSLIRAGRVYKIPRKGNAPPPPPTVPLPRLLPPAGSVVVPAPSAGR